MKLIFTPIIFSILFFIASCSYLARDVKLPVCDSYSKFAHDYYITHKKTAGVISNGQLDIFRGNGTLSKFSFDDNQGEDIENFLMRTANNGAVPITRYSQRKFVFIIIPPKTSFKNLSQVAVEGDKEVPLPSFLAVPKESFYSGICTERTQPFLISTVESFGDPNIPQLLVPRDTLERLVSKLYMAPDSYHPESVKERYLKYVSASKLDRNEVSVEPERVNPDTWHGWVEVMVRPKKRDFFDWLFETPWGEIVDLPGVYGVFDSDFSVPTIEQVSEELSIMEKGWEPKIWAVLKPTLDLTTIIDTLETDIKEGRITAGELRQRMNVLFESLNSIRMNSEQAIDQMRSDRNLFLSTVEIDYFSSVLIEGVLAIEKRINELVLAYNDAIRIRPGKELDIDLFLAPIPVIISGNIIEPVLKRDYSIPIKGTGAHLSLDLVGYLEPGQEVNQFAINAGGISSVEKMIARFSNHLKSEIYSKQSCSKQIKFVNMDIPPYLNGTGLVKKIDVGIQFRTCFTYYRPCGKWYKPRICKERGKTNLYKTTGHITARIELSTNTKDVKASIDWTGCIHKFLCASGHEETSAIVNELKVKDELKPFMEKLNPKVTEAGLVAGKKGGHYVALKLKSNDVNDAEAVITLELLRNR